MKLTLKPVEKGQAPVTATIVEILNSRVTVQHENGDFEDVQLKDIASFNGRVLFSAQTDFDTADANERTRKIWGHDQHSNTVSGDGSPEGEQLSPAGDLFANGDQEEAGTDAGQRELTPARSKRSKE
ncbi:MAG: hypothetical protein JWP57_4254 [Spirosoma sp.]|nr:hypothetical protein [Spirosoma sp.]